MVEETATVDPVKLDEDAAELRRLARLVRTAAQDSEDVLDPVVAQAGLDTWNCAVQRRCTSTIEDWGRLVSIGVDATRALARMFDWEANRREQQADEARRTVPAGG